MGSKWDTDDILCPTKARKSKHNRLSTEALWRNFLYSITSLYTYSKNF